MKTGTIIVLALIVIAAIIGIAVYTQSKAKVEVKEEKKGIGAGGLMQILSLFV